MATILHEQTEVECPSARMAGGALWLSAGDLERATGWSLKPEGFCKGTSACPYLRARLRTCWTGGVNLAALWEHLDCPLARDEAVKSGPGSTRRRPCLGPAVAAARHCC